MARTKAQIAGDIGKIQNGVTASPVAGRLADDILAATDESAFASAAAAVAAAVADTGTAGNAGKLVKLDAGGLLDGKDISTLGTAAEGATAALAAATTKADGTDADALLKTDVGGLIDGLDIHAMDNSIGLLQEGQGALGSLTTTAKGDLVSAINEVNAKPSAAGTFGQVHFNGEDASLGDATADITVDTTGFVPAVGDLIVFNATKIVATGLPGNAMAIGAQLFATLVDVGGSVKAKWVGGNDYSAITCSALILRA